MTHLTGDATIGKATHSTISELDRRRVAIPVDEDGLVLVSGNTVNTRSDSRNGRVQASSISELDGIPVVHLVDTNGAAWSSGASPTGTVDIDGYAAAGALDTDDVLLVSVDGTEGKVTTATLKTFFQDIDTLGAMPAYATGDLMILSDVSDSGTEKRSTLGTLGIFGSSTA